MIGFGVHLYVYDQQSLNGTLAVDSLFQTLAVDFYRLALPLRVPETLYSLNKSKISLSYVHLSLRMPLLRSHSTIGKYRHLAN